MEKKKMITNKIKIFIKWFLMFCNNKHKRHNILKLRGKIKIRPDYDYKKMRYDSHRPVSS